MNKKLTCTKCKKEKEKDLFCKSNTTKRGFSYICKKCTKIHRDKNKDKIKKYFKENKERYYKTRKKYREENEDKLKKYFKEYYLKNKEYKNTQSKKWRENNKEKIAIWQKKYREENKKALYIKKKKYREDNRKSIYETQRLWEEKKIDEDPVYKLSRKIRNRISLSFRRRGYTKKSSTFKILGCSYEFFIEYLNNNIYNFKFKDDGHDIDHIIPISTVKNEEDILKLNHYTNFQLLPSDYNRYIKRDNLWDKTHFEKWLKENE